jgi:hypothetical protein
VWAWANQFRTLATQLRADPLCRKQQIGAPGLGNPFFELRIAPAHKPTPSSKGRSASTPPPDLVYFPAQN